MNMPSDAALTWAQFEAVEIRVGTIVAAEPNPAARKPAYVLQVDLGELGVRLSSAQLTVRHPIDDLVGRQVAAVVNFPPKRVAGVRSEVLVLGVVTGAQEAVVIGPAQPVPNGSRVA